MSYTSSDFGFGLPPELIAQFPAEPRSASWLLHVDGPRLGDRVFNDPPTLLRAGDLLDE
jgi:S-adenosylmethionine:tRNA ribosyltransferase-isomerase